MRDEASARRGAGRSPASQERPGRWPPGFSDGHENHAAVLVLSALRGMTARTLLALAEREGAAAACLAAVRAGRAGSASDRVFAARLRAEEIVAGLERVGATAVPVGSPGFPPQLEQLADPPLCLFVRGRELAPAPAAVAIVGARACSSLGREFAHTIGRALADAGFCVVSGAARGIDAASHEGALADGGHTAAVLGCGIDVAYPPGSRALIARIADAGTVVSEYPPGVSAEPFRFPARNRIVVGLAASLVVVEGAAGSGSLISADHALELGRQVFAVPGAVTNPLAEVPNGLIRDGAALIRGPEDLLEDLCGNDLATPAGRRRVDLTLVEEAALSLVNEAVLPETVARGLHVPVIEVIPILMGLELKGLVRSVGGRFEPTLAARAPSGA